MIELTNQHFSRDERQAIVPHGKNVFLCVCRVFIDVNSQDYKEQIVNMGIFVGLVPAFAWGVQSIVMQKIGGKFTNKVVGMTMGTFLFAVVVSLIKTPQHLTGNLLLGSVLCGISWTIGQRPKANRSKRKQRKAKKSKPKQT